MVSNNIAVDSLIANEFAVELNGERIQGVLSVENLVTYKLDDDSNRVKVPFEVAKMVQRDGNAPFNKWLRETSAKRNTPELPRRDVTIVAVDDGVETRRWKASNAWIAEVRYSAFDSASFEMVAEVFVIMYDDIEETWPATENLDPVS